MTGMPPEQVVEDIEARCRRIGVELAESRKAVEVMRSTPNNAAISRCDTFSSAAIEAAFRARR